jgi:hypothetical protein
MAETAPDRSGNIPVPDPSIITTERLAGLADELRREMAALRDVLTGKIERSEGQLSSLKELHAEKFDSVQKRLDDSKTALDAAFLAQKGNAEKTEISLTKQIDFMGDRINEVKERLDRGEGVSSGARETRTEAHMTSAQLISIIVACFAGSTLILGIVEFAIRGTH